MRWAVLCVVLWVAGCAWGTRCIWADVNGDCGLINWENL